MGGKNDKIIKAEVKKDQAKKGRANPEAKGQGESAKAIEGEAPKGERPGNEKARAVDLSCSDCQTRNCYRQDSHYPTFCLTKANRVGADETRELYVGEGLDAKVAKAAAEVESEYYGRLTRLEETVVFALKLGAKKLGVASCFSFLDESAIYAKAARSAGLEVKTVACKVGSVDKSEIGLPEGHKFCPGEPEACCNPILQAKALNDWGSDVNVSLGLCVGHDYLFTKHSVAPAVTLAVKDRVLAHNPMGAIYASKLFYSRVLDFKKYPKSRLEPKK